MKSYFGILLLMVSVAVTLSAQAHNSVVVIPLSGDDLQPLKNIITVAKENGDFDDPEKALASISMPSESNQYLIVVAPGTYSIDTQLVMQPYVDIVGSGENITTISAARSADGVGSLGATIVAASHSTVRDLTIRNVSDSESGILSIGVYVGSNVSAKLRNVKVEIQGFYETGFYVDSGTLDIDDVDIVSSGEFSTQRGVEIFTGTLRMSNTNINFAGGWL